MATCCDCTKDIMLLCQQCQHCKNFTCQGSAYIHSTGLLSFLKQAQPCKCFAGGWDSAQAKSAPAASLQGSVCHWCLASTPHQGQPLRQAPTADLPCKPTALIQVAARAVSCNLCFCAMCSDGRSFEFTHSLLDVPAQCCSIFNNED